MPIRDLIVAHIQVGVVASAHSLLYALYLFRILSIEDIMNTSRHCTGTHHRVC